MYKSQDAYLRTIIVPKVNIPLADTNANTCVAEVVGNKNDTPAGDSLYSRVNDIRSKVSANKANGTYAYTNAGAEQTIYENTDSGTLKVVNGFWLDLVNMTQNGTIRLYYKVDGTNYRLVTSQTFTVLTDSDGIYINVNMGLKDAFKITYEEAADEGADRNLPYLVVWVNQ